MALGGSQTQQPTKNRVITGGGRLPVGVSCSLGRPPLILGGERKRRGEEEDGHQPAGYARMDGKQKWWGGSTQL